MKRDKYYLFREVAKKAVKEGSLYRDTRACRDDLVGFMTANSWFGMVLYGSGDDICLDNCECLEGPLSLWLKGYHRSTEERMDILADAYRNLFPQTCRLFTNYLRENGTYGFEGGLRVLDYLLSSLKRDITEYTEEELQPVIRDAAAYLAVSNETILLDFLKSLKKKGKLKLQWTYEAKSKRIVARENEAYSVGDFAFMAYMVFNPIAWKEHFLVEKAAADRRYADMWLFVSLHFCCGLRASDMERLPAPELPYPKLEIRQKILNGEFFGKESSELTEHWMYLTELLRRKPHKTAAYSGIPEIKFFIPESLLDVEGIILALALSHHEEGDPCVRAGAETSMLRAFFGERFAKAAGKRRFNTRRANKAYLQGIESTASPGPGRTKGYMLAALARSHKGGIGTLPEITDIYLRDSVFSGYTPEFILREMFERGIFGFVPAMLLTAYRRDDFRNLGVSGQTMLIKSIGLDAGEIEAVSNIVSLSMEKAEAAVYGILTDSGNSAERVQEILQNIAEGEIPAKQEGLLCLNLASGHACTEPERGSCMGCGYEVYTKSAFHLLMQEYIILMHKRNLAEGWEKERYTKLMNEGIVPAALHILESIPLLYPDADVQPLLDIMERGISYAAACK